MHYYLIMNFRIKVNYYEVKKFFLIIYLSILKHYALIRINLEMVKIEEYYFLCNQRNLIQKKKFKKSESPKISIISPIYNQEKYLHRYLMSIQNQEFSDLEIILIDDLSNDNTLKVIEELKEFDERIIFIKNNKRKGTLVSRNIGVLKSKADYLIFIDPDDIISQNILHHCFLLAKRFNYDLIRYNIYMGNYKMNLPDVVNNLKSKPIFKPNIFLYLFYGFGKLLQLDYYITNKLIKRTLFIRAINSINKYYLDQFMIDCEDGLMNYMLYKLSDSLYFTTKIGYYYIKTNRSITFNSDNFINRLKSNFLYFRFIFESTKNNNIEKNIANYIFFQISNRNKNSIIKLIKLQTSDYRFYSNIISLYLQDIFISLKSKLILKKMKKAIIKIKNIKLNNSRIFLAL